MSVYLKQVGCILPRVTLYSPHYLCWRVTAAAHTLITSSLSGNHMFISAKMHFIWSN